MNKVGLRSQRAVGVPPMLQKTTLAGTWKNSLCLNGYVFILGEKYNQHIKCVTSQMFLLRTSCH